MEYDLEKIYNVYKNDLFLEKTYRYIVPKEDKEKLMYDFYLISFLDQFNPENNVGSKISGFGQKINTPTTRIPLDENTIDSYEKIKEDLLTYLKEHMLNAVLFSVAAEFRHIFDSSNNLTTIYRVYFSFS